MSDQEIETPASSKAPVNDLEKKVEIQASEFRNVKLPMFWRSEPKLWFAVLEREFTAYGVRSDAVKCAAVLRHLDSPTMKIIADVIASPNASESYAQIKNTLITRLATSEETQLRQLLTGIELSNKNFNVQQLTRVLYIGEKCLYSLTDLKRLGRGI